GVVAAGLVVGAAIGPAPVPVDGADVGPVAGNGFGPCPELASGTAGFSLGVLPLLLRVLFPLPAPVPLAGAFCVGVPLATGVAGLLDCRVIRFKMIASSRKMPKIMLVAQVRTSPVFEPNAVFPPPPPNALAKPPPRPF